MGAVEDLVADLQAGIDGHDADLADRHLAHNVIWGGPFGTTVSGFDDLIESQRRLQADGAGGRVAVAHVARRGLDEGAERSAFSEMALYVLVEHEGDWWVIAGQNTPLRPELAAGGR